MRTQSSSLEKVILNIFSLLFIFIIIGVIFSIFVGIFFLLFSKGNEDKIKKGFNSIRAAIFGFIVSLVILFVFPMFFYIFKIPGYKIYTARNVINRSQEIISNFLKTFYKSHNINNLDTNL